MCNCRWETKLDWGSNLWFLGVDAKLGFSNVDILIVRKVNDCITVEVECMGNRGLASLDTGCVMK